MGREDLEQQVTRWLEQPDFREELRRDPVAALQRMGVALKLDEEDLAALRGIDWRLPDAELQTRLRETARDRARAT